MTELSGNKRKNKQPILEPLGKLVKKSLGPVMKGNTSTYYPTKFRLMIQQMTSIQYRNYRDVYACRFALIHSFIYHTNTSNVSTNC